MLSIAYAMGNPAAEGAKGFGGIGAFIPLVLMFVIFYFLLIRPQQKRAKEHREVLQNLKRGDTVITAGGIHGKISGLTDTMVTLEIADKVKIKVSRNQIAGLSKTSD